MSVRGRVVDGVVSKRPRKVRVGTAADAGRLCRTERKPDGVDGDTYTYYTRGLATTRAPGPVMVWDEAAEKAFPLIDPETRGYLYPLDEVEAWNAARPGQGSGVGTPTADNLRRTKIRATLVTAAEGGILQVADDGRTVVHGQPISPREAQAVTLLRSLGILEPAEVDGQRRWTLTDVGRRVRDRWAHS